MKWIRSASLRPLFALGFALAACSASEEDPAPLTTAETELGVANGMMTTEGVVAFLGLPFAEPPVDDLRFKPPVAISSWDSPLDASEFGPACPQPVDAGTGTLYDLNFGGEIFFAPNATYFSSWADEGMWQTGSTDAIRGSYGIPEPTTIALLGIGLIGLGAYRRRRK